MSSDSKKIMETLLGKTDVIWNWCGYYEESLQRLSEICDFGEIGKNYEKILEKVWKNIGNISHNLLKKKTFRWKPREISKELSGTYEKLYGNFK